MFTLKIKLSRDRIVIAVCIALTFISLGCHFFSFGGFPKRADTLDRRVEYLNGLGYNAYADSETKKKVLLPEKFDDIHTSYNQLQKEGGFDLTRYRGCVAELYTYELDRFCDLKEAKVNLLVYNNVIIGGDITTLERGGLCVPLMSTEDNQEKLKDN